MNRGLPTDRCVYCGWSRKTIVDSQQKGVSTIRCKHLSGRHRFTDLVVDWRHIEQLRFALDNGFSTSEIESEVGTKYGSILVMLNRRGHTEELEALKKRRAAEWSRRQQAINAERRR